MYELITVTCFQNEAPVYEHVLEHGFELQCILKTNWSKTHAKTCAKTGASILKHVGANTLAMDCAMTMVFGIKPLHW